MYNSDLNARRIPGFTAEISLYNYDQYPLVMSPFLETRIIPQRCMEGSCGSCSRHAAWEDDNGPESAGCWKKCCGSSGTFSDWRKCPESQCIRPPPRCTYFCNRPVQADCHSKRPFCSECLTKGGTCCWYISGDIMQCETA